MRTLIDHAVNPVNEELVIKVIDEPGPGGDCHDYLIDIKGATGDRDRSLCRLLFQNGPIKEAGVNGITQEALLAIVIDRLRGFESGEFKCRENAIALMFCEDALAMLKRRAQDRIARGVQGTNTK